MTVTTRRPGDATKAFPFTVCIIANPALEAPHQTGQFIRDPIMGLPQAFAAAADYIESSIFGALPGQRELLLGDPAIAPHVRVLEIFPHGAPVTAANALVAQDALSTMLIARRTEIAAFLAAAGLQTDVVYAVSASTSHTRASAWYTSDDDTRPGVPFVLDGAALTHRFHPRVPGTIALPVASTGPTAAHEFLHAVSSYTNGMITDLYVNGTPALNCKVGRPIPVTFATYDGTTFRSDPTRDHLGYPASWHSFHCELINSAMPAVMDNYWLSPAPIACENDQITRQFVFDRVRAKISRP